MSLQEKIASNKAVVGVVGLGYVGLPLLAAFHRAGFPVIGFDVDEIKIVALHRGENYLCHLGEHLVRDMKALGRFDATSDLSRLSEADAIFICVPTPLGIHLEPDLSYIEKTTEAIARSLRAGQLVVLESTTYPGTTREVVLPPLEATGLRCGQDFFLAYSPEREDPGRKDFNTQSIPKLVGGIDAVSGELAVALYRKAIDQVIPVTSPEVAEAAKLLENIYRCVNIALVNEMKIILTAMNIDVWEVVRAAATKPFGFQAFYPGPGLGGHCIPIDPYYLTWKAKEFGHTSRFIEWAGQVNHGMPDFVVQRVALALNDQCKSIRGSRLLILGLAYKPDVDDVRESPAVVIIEKLQQLGGVVEYNDPHIPTAPRMRQHDLNLSSQPLTPEMLRCYDAVIIVTHHRAYDWQMIADHAALIVDTRNALRDVTGDRLHIISA